MHRKKKHNPAQLRFGFPPEAGPQLVACWHRLQALFPNHMVFLVQSGHFVTLHEQGIGILEQRGCVIYNSPAAYCAFPMERAPGYFPLIIDAGLNFVICDPPDDPGRFVFT